MKQLKSFRKYSIGFIVGLSLIGSIGYSANNGSIGSLFNYGNLDGQVGVYRLDGQNIEDGTVTTNEIHYKTIKTEDLAANSVTSIELSDNSVNSIKVADNSLTSSDLSSNSVGNSELNNSEIFTIGGLGIYDGANAKIGLTNAGDGIFIGDLKVGGNVGIGTTSPSSKLEVIGKIKASTPISTDPGNIVATKEYVDNKLSTGINIVLGLVSEGEVLSSKEISVTGGGAFTSGTEQTVILKSNGKISYTLSSTCTGVGTSTTIFAAVYKNGVLINQIKTGDSSLSKTGIITVNSGDTIKVYSSSYSAAHMTCTGTSKANANLILKGVYIW